MENFIQDYYNRGRKGRRVYKHWGELTGKCRGLQCVGPCDKPSVSASWCSVKSGSHPLTRLRDRSSIFLDYISKNDSQILEKEDVYLKGAEKLFIIANFLRKFTYNIFTSVLIIASSKKRLGGAYVRKKPVESLVMLMESLRLS